MQKLTPLGALYKEKQDQGWSLERIARWRKVSVRAVKATIGKHAAGKLGRPPKKEGQ